MWKNKHSTIQNEKIINIVCAILNGIIKLSKEKQDIWQSCNNFLCIKFLHNSIKKEPRNFLSMFDWMQASSIWLIMSFTAHSWNCHRQFLLEKRKCNRNKNTPQNDTKKSYNINLVLVFTDLTFLSRFYIIVILLPFKRQICYSHSSIPRVPSCWCIILKVSLRLRKLKL